MSIRLGDAPDTSVATLRPDVVGRGPWALAWRRLRADKVAIASFAVIVLMVLVAVFAPVFAHVTGHPPNMQYHQAGLTPDGLPKPPSATFLPGTFS
jgi:peptide/nickel transport system permease protein